jgi:hypothetical protein
LRNLRQARQFAVVLFSKFAQRQDDGGGIGTSRNSNADVLCLIDSKCLNIVRVVSAVHDLCPSRLLISLLTLLLAIDDGSLVCASTDHSISVRTHCNVKAICQMALYPLGKGVVLSIPETDFTSRVSRDNCAIRQTLDRPNQHFLWAARRALSEGNCAQLLAIADIKQTNRAIGIARDDSVTVLEGNAEHASSLSGRTHQAEEFNIVIRGG